MDQPIPITRDELAQADHMVRCLPFATEEQWCFHKHIEFVSDLWQILLGPTASDRNTERSTSRSESRR
jgi:hypothetical protein